jgi:hypothetical protein
MLAVVVIALRTVVEVGVMLVNVVVEIVRVGLMACRAMRHFNEAIVSLHLFHADSAFQKSGSRT